MLYIVLASSHFVRKLVSNPQANIGACTRLKCSIQQKKTWFLVVFEISIPSFALPEMSFKQCHEMTGPDVVLTFGPNLALTKCFAQAKIGLLQNGMIHWAQVVAKWFLSLYKWTLKWNMGPTMSYRKCAQGYIKYIYIYIYINRVILYI